MKKQLLRAALLCGFGLTFSAVSAQTRYVDDVFSEAIKQSDITYDSNRSVNIGHPLIPGGPIITANLKCDIYTPPATDTIANRPVVIIAHTGSFLPAIVNRQATGNKNDSAIVELCNRFAKKGYVAVAMNYRLGWNAASTVQAEATEGLLKATYRGIQDVRNCIRFIRANAATYGIDTAKIIVGGQGTGGYIALALGTVDKRTEIESNLKFQRGDLSPMVSVDTLGDWNGIGGASFFNYGGDPNVSGNAHMVFNYGGSMGDLAWLESSSLPVVSLHVVTDPFAPYNTGDVRVPNGPIVIPSASGAGDLIPKANTIGVNAKINSVTYTDVYSTRAMQASNNVPNLFPFYTAFPADGAPWEWWDRTSVQAAQTGTFYVYPIPASGRAADSLSFLVNPFMSASKGRAYIDTVVNFVAPRIAAQFSLNTGLREINNVSNYLSVYPNPANDVLNINVDVKAGNVSSYRLIDITGRELINRAATSNSFNVNVTELNSGMYFVHVMMNDGSIATKRVLVK